MNYSKPITYNRNPITSDRKLQKFGKNLFWSLCCPVIFLILAIIFSQTSGTGLFILSTPRDTLVNVTAIGRTLVMTLIAALALNTNLNSGRMDFSLGATGILAVLLASLVLKVDTISATNALTPSYIFALLGLSILFGMLLGFIHSIILILTKLPPIVISLGMCLVYEGIAKVVANSMGASGTVSLAPSAQTTSFFQEPIILIPLLVVVALFMAAALCYTRYGYNKLALVYNQKISVDTGINEVLHCIVSFIIAGALIAIYQVMASCGTSSISVQVNLGSSGTVFKNFLPIFIGGLLAKYNNQIVGLLLGVFATTVLYSYGFDNASFINSTVSSLINGFSIFAVLVYMVDKQRFINWVKMVIYVRKEKRLNPEMKGEIK